MFIASQKFSFENLSNEKRFPFKQKKNEYKTTSHVMSFLNTFPSDVTLLVDLYIFLINVLGVRNKEMC